MSDPFTWMVIISSVASAGAKIQEARVTKQIEGMRQEQFKSEMRTAEIQAKQQHIELLDELAYANSSIVANATAQGILAYASPSLSALRQDNFEKHDRNVQATKLNLAQQRSNTQILVKLSQLRTKSAKTTGLLGAISDLAGAGAAVYRLRGPGKTVKTGSENTDYLASGLPPNG